MVEKVLRTKLCDILGIEYPLILAGMGGSCGPALAAAVSNAGGLGVLGVTMLEPDDIRDWIRRTRELTDKPFGCDILLPAGMPKGLTIDDIKAQVPAEALAAVNKLREDLGIPKAKEQAMELALSLDLAERQVEAILDEKVAVFASGLGVPDWLVNDAHSQGMKVIGLAGNVKSALKQAEAGVDILIAQGHEAGGHTGRVGTMALVPQVVDAINHIPVVAAGGIGDGRGLAASLALGAVGVWVGTAFLATPEANLEMIEGGWLTQLESDNWKQKLLQSSEEDTRVSKIYTGKTARRINEKLIMEWEKAGVPTLPMPLQFFLIREIAAGIREAGLTDYMGGFAGQIMGMVKEIKPAKQIVEEIITETINILKNRFPNEVVFQ